MIGSLTNCCCGGGGGGLIDPGTLCVCHAVPSTITLTSHNTTCGPCSPGSPCNTGIQSTTMVYNSIGHYWLSPILVFPPCSGGGCANSATTFAQYRLDCNGSNWDFSTAPVTGGVVGTFSVFLSYSSTGSNSCSPFNLNTALANHAFGFGSVPCPVNTLTLS